MINIPNLLSVFRIILVPCFVFIYFSAQNEDVAYFPAIIVLISGITDILDGYIARRFNMITKLGKFLDPLADKLTQVTIVACLAVNYRVFIIILIVYFIKELCMLIGGIWFIRRFSVLKVSQWFGKVATIEFHIAVMLIILFPKMDVVPFYILVGLTLFCAIFAFVRYIIEFLRIMKV